MVTLSVAMITYNQEQYIAQALDSVLMQAVNFDYEIVIGDDLSSDGTRDILRDYAARHPDKIRLLLNEQNLGMVANIVQVLRACQGTYIAILEGDDFWNSPHKLQQQVDYMRANPGCSLSYHPVKWLYDDGRIEQQPLIPPDRNILTMDDVIRTYQINTGSIVMRNDVDRYPQGFEAILMDRSLHVLAASLGEIHRFSDEYLATYRRKAGVTNTLGGHYIAFQQLQIVVYEWINDYTSRRYQHVVRRTQFRCGTRLLRASLHTGAYWQAVTHLWLILRTLPYVLWYQLRRIYARMAGSLREFSPVLYNGLRRLKRATLWIKPDERG